MTGSGQIAGPAATVTVPTAAAMRALGGRLAGLLRAGDLVILIGGLGAGKTTLVQGIGAGLGVRGPVTSPTFVIARVHPSLSGGPDLVHADAYRLTSPAEVDRPWTPRSPWSSGAAASPKGWPPTGWR
jgi:tRNA threonylcarbamoyladenosine biosynthesis protein TsaE